MASPSSPPSRPASTGGKAPIRIRCWMVAEEAPSHDGTLCCSVWEAEEAFVDPEPIKRPKWGIQIYDTRSDSGKDMTRLKELGLKIYKDTWEDRSAMGRGTLDRIDIYGLAMPEHTPTAERAERCKAHNMEEIAARNATGKADFYIPQMPQDSLYPDRRSILVIHRPQDKWDEPDEGGFLYVRWGHQFNMRKPEPDRGAVSSPERSDYKPEFFRYQYTDEVPGVLQNMRDGVEWFENNYVDSGLLDEELKQAAEKEVK
ncbi:hypothetical protein NM208_g3328 [Fusarium decemcellulare]|uniref:Uncharacterized protein n=1 Tax=Fusarium decemcellulare TaxID=57161 RepID=A0ACC1SPD2_9HYPO|nr:hypothetical protein NM208_g3328 [Fusarium decemcellulare]